MKCHNYCTLHHSRLLCRSLLEQQGSPHTPAEPVAGRNRMPAGRALEAATPVGAFELPIVFVVANKGHSSSTSQSRHRRTAPAKCNHHARQGCLAARGGLAEEEDFFVPKDSLGRNTPATSGHAARVGPQRHL